jgi:hypothetical protein
VREAVESCLTAGLERLAQQPLGRFLRSVGSHRHVDCIRAIELDGSFDGLHVARVLEDGFLVSHVPQNERAPGPCQMLRSAND